MRTDTVGGATGDYKRVFLSKPGETGRRDNGPSAKGEDKDDKDKDAIFIGSIQCSLVF